jgi:hypothetical protein
VQFRTATRFRDVYSKIVKYDTAVDRDWPVHIDESDVTINFCLGTDFVGSHLQARPRGAVARWWQGVGYPLG